MAVNKESLSLFKDYVLDLKEKSASCSNSFFLDEATSLDSVLSDQLKLTDITTKITEEPDLIAALPLRVELTLATALRQATQARYKPLNKHEKVLKHNTGALRAINSEVLRVEAELGNN